MRLFRTPQFRRAQWAAVQLAIRHALPEPNDYIIGQIVVFLEKNYPEVLLELEPYADELRHFAQEYDTHLEGIT